MNKKHETLGNFKYEIPDAPKPRNKMLNPDFVGFWPRVAAPLLGFYVVSYIVNIVNLALLATLSTDEHLKEADLLAKKNTEQVPSDIKAYIYNNIHDYIYTNLPYLLILYLLYILYLSIMESSRYQGGLGKRMIGAIVIDANGNRISFTKALIRNLLKILSLVSILGVLLIGFDKRKRGLHDIICNTYVVRYD